jgi:glycosyltransferase involved in cell wall biosynthesis
LKLAAKSFFFKALRPRITACLAVGQDNDDYWRHYFGEAFPIFPCVYAVDNDFFRRACAAASIHREELRSSLHLDPARPIILFAAKLIPRKRCADLLEAYFELCNSISPQVRPYLLVIGDGNERTTLEARVRQVSAEDVRFLGFRNQTELPRFYDLCNVFVLPSIHEPWGLAINEAMNAGRPVVVSDQVGCLRDLVHPGINGAVFPAMNIHALAESLRALLNNSATLKTMGSESLRLVAGYSFQQNIAGLRKALHAFCPALQSLNRGYFHE